MRLIDADALEYVGNHIGDEYEDRFHDKQWIYRCDIDKAPTVDVPDKKIGKWKLNSNYPDMLICSECDGHFDCWHWEIEEMHYCPNCGSLMMGEGDGI